MGLDGYVACDCIEKGTARVPAAIAGLVKVDPGTGSNYLDSADRRLRQVYSKWCASRPCPHGDFMLVTRRLGNVDGISRVRKFLSARVRDPASEFRVLWRRVLYSCVHSGDTMPVKEVARLQQELKRRPKPGSASVTEFFTRLEELVDASLRVGKPLGF